MRDEYDIERGLPDEGALLELLNESFDSWGDAEYLNWKYDRPGDEEATGYHVVRGDDLVGFRGMCERTIAGANDGYDCYICGDACVSSDHRGEGLYSALREATESEIERRGSDFCGLYTRKGHIPFEVSRDRGWMYRTLPLYVRVLEPSNVIPHYARLVIDEEGTIASLLERFGGRVRLDTGGSHLRLDRLLGGPSREPARSVAIPLPEWVTTAAVEVAGSDSIRESVERRLSSSRPAPSDRIDVSIHRSVDDDLLESIAELYETVTAGYEFRFRRHDADLRHMFDHPHVLAVVTARRGEKVVGVAPTVLKETADTVEAWVLDAVAATDEVFDALVARVEEVASDRGADMVVMVSNDDPGSRWARIDKQVLMWKPYGTDTRPLETGSLFAGLYDVV